MKRLGVMIEDVELPGGRRLQVAGFTAPDGPARAEIVSGMDADPLGLLVEGDRVTVPAAALPKLIGALERIAEELK